MTFPTLNSQDKWSRNLKENINISFFTLLLYDILTYCYMTVTQKHALLFWKNKILGIAILQGFFKKECYKIFFLFFYNYSFFTTNQPPLGSPVESRPFEVFGDLLCHHAHLAVFMNYVISNSDPSALVCQKNLHKNCRNYSDNILFSSSFSIWLLLPTKREA